MQVTKQQLMEAIKNLPDDCRLNVSIDQGDIIPVEEFTLSTLPETGTPSEFCLDFTLRY